MKNTITSKKGPRVEVLKRSYRYRANVQGRNFYFPLPSYRDEALKRADEIRDCLRSETVDQVREKFHPKYKPQTGGAVPYKVFRDFIRGQYRAATGLSSVTATTYAGAYGRVVRHALGKEDIDAFDMHDFKASWVDDLKLGILGGARTSAEEVSKKRTFNAILRNLKAVVNPDAIPVFEAKSWKFGWVSALRDVRTYKRVKKVWAGVGEDPTEGIHDFVDTLDGDEYVVAALALYSGLRRKETAHASRSWVQRAGSEYRIWIVPKDNFVQKGTPGYTIIPKRILDEVESRSLTHHERFLKTNSHRLFRAVSKKLRTVIDVKHPLHELRRLFGTYITNRYDLWTAQTYLRHDSPQTTFDSYAHGKLSDDLLSLWE